MARSPRKSSTCRTSGPRLSLRTRPAGLLPPTGGDGGGGATSAGLATRLAVIGGFGREHREGDHPARRQPLRDPLGVILGPRLLARAAVDGAVSRRAQAVRALGGPGLLALADPLLDLHDRGDERFRRRRASRDVHVHRDDL